jgi:hypothetical protein
VLRQHDRVTPEAIELAAAGLQNVTHAIRRGVRRDDADLAFINSAEELGDVAGDGTAECGYSSPSGFVSTS